MNVFLCNNYSHTAISSLCSSNSEAKASELLEHIDEIFHWWMYVDLHNIFDYLTT